MLLLIFGGVLAGIFVFSMIHSRFPFRFLCIKQIDDVLPMRVFAFAFQIWDVYSDVSVCYTYWKIYAAIPLKPLYFYFALISTLCLSIPWAINVIFSVVFLPRKLNRRAKQWLIGSMDRWFSFLTLITGNVYSSLLICNSKILGMTAFDMGLSKWELRRLRNVSYVTILFEVE